MVIFAVSGLPSSADTPTPSPEPSPSTSPLPSLSPEPTPDPTPEPLPPTPPPAPVDASPYTPPPATIDPAYTGPLRPGDWVEISGTDSCLNMRWDPRIPAPAPDGAVIDNVMNCLPDGFVGRLDAFEWGRSSFPVLADGHRWWHLVGQGWAAEEFLRPHHQGGIPWPERPELAGAGLIAYMRTDSSIWLMGADGANQRQIVPAPGQSVYISALRWSPAGDRLSYTMRSWDASGAAVRTTIIDPSGTVTVELAGLAEAVWSPDGSRLSAIRVDREGEMSGYYGTPIVFDLNSGVETPVGVLTSMHTAPAWSPDGSAVAYVCMSNYIGQPDGSLVIDPERSCGGDGLRIAAADGSGARVLLPMEPATGYYFANPSWAPSGQTIALWSQQDGAGCRGYTFVDAVSGASASCAASPPQALFIGGRCGGGSEMGASTWTPDGRLVFAAQGAGQSGLFVHNPATGARTVIPNMGAGPANITNDGANLTFAGGNHIWAAGTDGSNLTLLAEGHSPAWQPKP